MAVGIRQEDQKAVANASGPLLFQMRSRVLVGFSVLGLSGWKVLVLWLAPHWGASRCLRTNPPKDLAAAA